MHEGVVTCRPDTPVEEVAGAMSAHHVSALVVVDGEGYAVGLISRTDLVNATFVQPYMRHWRGMAARHLMTSPVISVRADSPLDEALTLIHRHRIHRVVVTVVEGARERPIGVLSVTDLAGRVAGRDAPTA
jgi:CBS domain-containing protein